MTAFNRQLSIKDVWVESFHMYCKILPRVWPLAALIGGILSIPVVLNVLYPIKPDTNLITTAHIVCFVVSFIILAIKVYLTTVLLHRTSVISEGQDVTLHASFVLVEKKYIKMIISLLIVYIACVLGALMFILPMFFLFILLIMVQPIILFDDKSSFVAIKESSKLVWGNWWNTFCVFVIMLPIVFFVLILLSMLVFALKLFSVQSLWYMIVGYALIMILMNLFSYPLYTACLLVQFKNLKAQRHALLI